MKLQNASAPLTLGLLSVVFCLTLVGSLCVGQDAVTSVKEFLKDSTIAQIDDQAFAKVALSQTQRDQVKVVLWESHLANLREQRKAEWEAKQIKLGEQVMKFDYRTFGEKPDGGRSLYISMHGGGGAPKRVNDQQWRNQIGLYKPKEGIYVAPRAPTNSWNLWHEGHIDPMFTRLIEDAIALADVNPNRVYLMGYSAGGDGVYQLAPRMADQVAAAAMMAGHPNNAKAFGLRNIGFTLHMGGKDSAYQRNEVARAWKKRLAELQKQDPEGYVHEVVIHEAHGHWMQRDDAVAVPWMSRFTRNPFPDKVVWYQSGVTHDRYYWLAVNQANQKGGTHIVASRAGQTFTIEQADGVDSLTIRFNDQMVDMEKPVVVKLKDRVVYEGVLKPTVAVMAKTLSQRGDPESVYSAEVDVDLSGQ